MFPFHYAFLIKNIDQARRFYGEVLGCEEGRSAESWVDFDFFGNQISCHVSEVIPEPINCGNVDGITVPIPHFGALVSFEVFKELRNRLEKEGIKFVVKPQVRYEGDVGEQWTMFFSDPFGNPIEIKSFKDNSETFSTGQ